MVGHHDLLQCVSVFICLSIMVAQAEDGYGDWLGRSGHVCLVLNGTDPYELVDFNVWRSLIKVVSVESRDTRRKWLWWLARGFQSETKLWQMDLDVTIFIRGYILPASRVRRKERANMLFSDLGCRPRMGLDNTVFWGQMCQYGNAQEDSCGIVALIWDQASNLFEFS